MIYLHSSHNLYTKDCYLCKSVNVSCFLVNQLWTLIILWPYANKPPYPVNPRTLVYSRANEARLRGAVPTFSMLIFSGMTMMQRYPLTAAARARPIPETRGKSHEFANLQQPGSFKAEWGHIPVFPEVGSMMVSPGLRVPARSASSIIRRLILSFTLPPALKNSHLATANTSQTEAFWLITFQSQKAVKPHQSTARRLTNFTFKSKCFGDLVDAHHGSVPDLVQDVWKNEWRTCSGQGSWAKADYLCWYSYYNCVL